MIKYIYLGAGFLLALCFVGCIAFGIQRGELNVVSDCKMYGKHGVDGAQVIYCNLDPDPFTIKIIDTKVGKKR